MGFWRWFWGPPKVNTIDELVVTCKTPEALLEYAKCHFIKKNRELDAQNWLPPATAFKLLQARDDDAIKDAINCDDMASVFCYVLLKQGYKASCVYVAMRGKAHAVCSYLVPGGIRYLDNTLRISRRYNDATEMCHDIYDAPVFAWYMEPTTDNGYCKGAIIKL